MKNWLIKKILSSKKAWYAIAALVIPFVAVKMGVDEKTASEMVYAIIALILGQGIADFGKHKK